MKSQMALVSGHWGGRKASIYALASRKGENDMTCGNNYSSIKIELWKWNGINSDLWWITTQSKPNLHQPQRGASLPLKLHFPILSTPRIIGQAAVRCSRDNWVGRGVKFMSGRASWKTFGDKMGSCGSMGLAWGGGASIDRKQKQTLTQHQPKQCSELLCLR